MSRDWKTGDVAMVTGPRHMLYPTSRENATIPCRRERDVWYAIGLKNRGFTDREVVDVAPLELVVIDPEQIPHLGDFDEDAARALSRIADDVAEIADGGLDATEEIIRWLADQMPKPPKPDEPQGLGAVVEDADGARWVRHSTETTVRHWLGASGEGRRRYDEIAVIRMLSGGVA